MKSQRRRLLEKSFTGGVIVILAVIIFASKVNAQTQTRERRAAPPTSADAAASKTQTDSAGTVTATKQTKTQANDAKTLGEVPKAVTTPLKDGEPSKADESAREVKPSGAAKGSKATDIPAEILANRQEDASEEAAAIVPYYNNFLSSYRLGPEDVISITVFGQPNYSKQGIVVPPDGKISYYLIPEGVFVAGKTVQQVQDELTKKLDEYIIDPKVTVSLDKAQSTRYAVIGDVVHPGIRLMTRRLSLTEAIAEAGGILQTGDKKKVVLLRRQNDNSVAATTINVEAIMRGRAPDNIFLAPGDQIIVPGNRIKTLQTIFGIAQIFSFARAFAPTY